MNEPNTYHIAERTNSNTNVSRVLMINLITSLNFLSSFSNVFIPDKSFCLILPLYPKCYDYKYIVMVNQIQDFFFFSVNVLGISK